MKKPDNSIDKAEQTNLTDAELQQIAGGQSKTPESASPDKSTVKALPVSEADMCKGGGPRITVFGGRGN